MSGTRALGVWAVVAAVGAALLGLLGGCSTHGDQLHREVRQFDAPHLPETRLRITTANGGIVVREGTQELVLIRAEVKATSPERLAATEVTAERLADGTLAIGVVWPNAKRESREGCEFEVTLPRASGVELRTTNGSIESTGMGGEAVLTTSNGSIKSRDHAGPVVAQTSNGTIRVTAAAGSVRAKTSNGWVRVEDAAAGVDAQTSNGAVDVTLANTSPGPVRVRTSNGAVDLRLGRGFQGELSMRGGRGKLDLSGLDGAQVLSMASGSARVKIGDAGDASSVQADNGAIRVRGVGG